MKTVSSAMAAHLSGVALTLCTCWHITRNDGVILGYTDAQQDVIVGGLRYKATSGFTRTSFKSSSDLSVNNMEMRVAFRDGDFSERDVRAGLYNDCDVAVYIVNFRDLSLAPVLYAVGFMGQVEIKDGVFSGEVRSLTQHLQQSFGESYSPGCRASFGDFRCRFDVASLTRQGTVATVSGSRTTFQAAPDIPGADGIYQFGKVKWLTGANAGAVSEVSGWDAASATVTFFLSTPFPMAVGDTFAITEGCNKLRSRCVALGNIANFRGEPDAPGADLVGETPNYLGG